MNIRDVLKKNRGRFSSVIPPALLEVPLFVFDFTATNTGLAELDIRDTVAFESYVAGAIKNAGARMGIGGYGEDRVVYQSELFQQDGEARSVHLAVDIWMPAGTELFATLPARVHSFQINDHFLDYGPTIILEHELEGVHFYTLYGHLATSSLESLEVGKEIRAGEHVATVGESHENGHWPPHLHFQVIADILGKRGDFPGVARPSEKDYWLGLCPDPNLILMVRDLMTQAN